MNEHCERAPKCTVPGCRHIGVNEAGDVVALCGLGQWLMEVGSSPESGIMMLAATRRPSKWSWWTAKTSSTAAAAII